MLNALKRVTSRQRPIPVGTALLALVAMIVPAMALSAQAGVLIPAAPITNAADWTPRVVDDAAHPESGVLDYRMIGSTMYAAGEFGTVLSASRASTYTRYGIFSFSATTGAVSSWAPVTNGSVSALEATADGHYLYLGGTFTSFAGRSSRLIRLDVATLQPDPNFKPVAINGRVDDLALVGSRLFVAGHFDGGIAALDPVTGADTGYFAGTRAAGQQPGYPTSVHKFAVNPAHTRLVILGSFTSIGGQARQQAAILVLGSSSASVSGWYSTRWDEACSTKHRWYTEAVDWAPDGSYFAIATTGGPAPSTTKLCDTVTRWAPSDSANQQPTWINYSGGDTFHAVTVTNHGIFVSGHFRWLDNPLGSDSAGPGAVSRLGLGQIDSATGRATSWNPTKSIEGGKGGYVLYFTSAGMWLGHYEKMLTGELHEGVGFLPFT